MLRLILVKIRLGWYQRNVFLLRTHEPSSNLGGPPVCTFYLSKPHDLSSHRQAGDLPQDYRREHQADLF